MKRIFIKYNPYQVTTEILIDDKPLKKNSKLNHPEQRLQEWVDKLPDLLFEECSTRDFEITFHGTILDYEDVVAAAEEAKSKGISIVLKHIPAKEVKDKEQAIEKIFEDIQKGPFEELKLPSVINAFKMASSKDFEVNVIACMSAGKSTLINALLSQKLMPAKKEACTATITRIKDNDADHFEAKVYDKDDALIETQPLLTYDIMQRLNDDPNVSKIEVEGNIPFVNSEEISLVLVDTPGPNNARNEEHKATTYKMIDNSSKAVVLYVMRPPVGSEDDAKLLKKVADSMKVGGKQSRDRFIFVVNGLDEFKKDEDSIEATLKKVRDYLADNGIYNPNIFPTSALTALDIRTVLACSDDDDDDDVYEAKGKVRKINRNEEMHFEKYAPLPASATGIIANRLAKAIELKDDKEQALIHSGVVPVEEAIRMYVLKYSKTAKIKNIVDTFINRVESAKTFEVAMEEIAENEAEKDAIVAKIEGINAKLESGEEAKKFKNDIKKLNYDKEITERSNEIVKKAEEKITAQLEKAKKEEMTRTEAEEMYKKLLKAASDVQAEMSVDLENLVNGTVKRNANDLLKRYKDKLADLVRELKKMGDVEIDPFEMMRGDISGMDDLESFLANSTDTKSVWEVVGTHKSYKEVFGLRRWLNKTIGTSFNVDYDLIDDYDWVEHEYINGDKLSAQFIVPVQKKLYKNQSSAIEYAKKGAELVKRSFADKFDELDALLKQKLEELKECALDEKVAQEELEKAKSRKAWLEDIQARINAILDI